MPPKPKFTREEIIDTAYTIAREKGIGNVGARGVAETLGATVSPIFTVFSGMDELKGEVRNRAAAWFAGELSACAGSAATFRTIAMRWVALAVEEPWLYRMLFFPETSSGAETVTFGETFPEAAAAIAESASADLGLEREDGVRFAERLMQSANGAAAAFLSGFSAYSPRAAARMLSGDCLGLVLPLKMQDGNVDPAFTERMTASLGSLFYWTD